MKKYMIPLRLIYFLVVSILKTVTLDLYKNIHLGIVHSLKPEERLKLKRDLETKKKVDLISERLKRIEKLVYSIFEDPEYIKSDKGKYDLKELKKEAGK